MSVKGDKGPPTAAVVPVFSAWASKINWAQIISLAAVVAAIWNIQISSELQTGLVTGILALCGLLDILTAVFRTYFTKSVTPEAISDAKTIAEPNAQLQPQALMSLVEPKVVDARRPPDTLAA